VLGLCVQLGLFLQYFNLKQVFRVRYILFFQVSERETSRLGSSAVRVLCFPTASIASAVSLVTHSDHSEEDVEAAKNKIVYVAENILSEKH